MSSKVVNAMKEREAIKRAAAERRRAEILLAATPKKAKAKKAKVAKAPEPVVVEPAPATITEADDVDAVVEGPEPIEAYTG